MVKFLICDNPVNLRPKIMIGEKMRISTKVCYGLKILSVLADNYNKGLVTSKEIARRERLSKKYTDNLLGILEKSKMVSSHRGAKGGYSLTMSPNLITVKEAFEALEGSVLSVNCIDSKGKCKYFPGCTGHRIWVNLKSVISRALERVTIAEVSKKEGIYYI